MAADNPSFAGRRERTLPRGGCRFRSWYSLAYVCKQIELFFTTKASSGLVANGQATGRGPRRTISIECPKQGTAVSVDPA